MRESFASKFICVSSVLFWKPKNDFNVDCIQIERRRSREKSENRHQNKSAKKKYCDDEVEHYLGQKEKHAKEGKFNFTTLNMYVIVMGTFHDRGPTGETASPHTLQQNFFRNKTRLGNLLDHSLTKIGRKKCCHFLRDEFLANIRVGALWVVIKNKQANWFVKRKDGGRNNSFWKLSIWCRELANLMSLRRI